MPFIFVKRINNIIYSAIVICFNLYIPICYFPGNNTLLIDIIILIISTRK